MQVQWHSTTKYSIPYTRGCSTFCTGKSMSEALILESINPQYDERLFIKFPEKYKLRICCVQILFWMSKQKNNFCAQHVLSLYFSGYSMKNLKIYLYENPSYASVLSILISFHHIFFTPNVFQSCTWIIKFK